MHCCGMHDGDAVSFRTPRGWSAPAVVLSQEPLGEGQEESGDLQAMSVLRTCRLGVLAVCLGLASGWAAELADPEVTSAERTLKDAAVGKDGPALVAFFRERTLTVADQDRLAQMIRHLGANDFFAREKASADLIKAGRAALPYLKSAVADPDLEISRRAQDCLDNIHLSRTSNLVLAATRMLVQCRPPESAEVLLGYLPFAEEEMVEDALLAALRQVAFRDGKPDPVFSAALADRMPLRRAAAAQILGGQTKAEDRQPVLRLLTDTDVRVRYEAAAALASAGERSAVPVLTALLTDAPLPLAWQVEDLLCRLLDEQSGLPGLGNGSSTERRRSRDSWEGWWQANGARADLTRLKQEEPYRGLTLVCEYDGGPSGGRVFEQTKDGKVRWEVTGLSGPNDAQILPGGRVLVAERNGGKVSERDHQGNILWQFNTSSPIACQRLPGGNTLVATFNDLLEVTPDGKTVHSLQHPNNFRHALRLRNGNILYVSSTGEIGELDPEWKPVRTITPAQWGKGAGYWASIEPLPGARFLVVYGGSNKVVELDGSGKVVWEFNQPSPVFATRLRNGNTLISCFEGRALVEVTRDGKEVSKQSLPGRPFTVRRY